MTRDTKLYDILDVTPGANANEIKKVKININLNWKLN